MKKKVWFDAMEMGFANFNNHKNAQVGDMIELTTEEVRELFEANVVSKDIIYSNNDSVHMVVSHILNNSIMGNIVVLSEVEMGVTTNDSPFGAWLKNKVEVN